MNAATYGKLVNGEIEYKQPQQRPTVATNEYTPAQLEKLMTKMRTYRMTNEQYNRCAEMIRVGRVDKAIQMASVGRPMPFITEMVLYAAMEE